MIRILYLITDSNFGGAETLLYQIASSLDRDRYSILVCSIKPEGAMLRHLKNEGIPTASLNFNFIKHPWRALPAFVKLIKLLRKFNPDIVHASLFQADIMGAAAGWICRVPVRIATVHMVLRHKMPALIAERIFSPWITRYIAVSENIRDFYMRRLALPKNKISVIYNVVDAEETIKRSREKTETLWPRDSRPASNERLPRLVFAGRLDKQKGLPCLLEALENLKKSGHPATALLIGDGPEKNNLKKLSRDKGLDDLVTFAGFQPNPMPFIASCDAFVLPSLEEGLPFVLLEAMALSKPIVATAVGAVPEAVNHGDAALLVLPADAQALARAIAQIVSDAALAQRLGQKAGEIARSRFGIGRALNDLESLYQTLLKKI